MKQYIKIMMASLLLLVIGGCSTFTGGDVSQSGIGGGGSSSNVGGVEIDFVENNPPSEMFKGTSYDFAFIFRNSQMHEVDDLKLKISGFDRGNVQGIPEQDSVGPISKFSEVAGPGLKIDYIYEGVVVDNFEKSFRLDPKIRYCYSQLSFRKEGICVPATNNVCGDDIVVDKAVETNGVFDFKIQRVNAISGKIRIDFEMTNRGSGRVVDECFESEGFASDFGAVIARLGTQEGDCKPAGTEKYIFTNGKANMYCEFDRTGDDSYPSQVYISAGSLYEQEKSLSITALDPAFGVS